MFFTRRILREIPVFKIIDILIFATER